MAVVEVGKLSLKAINSEMVLSDFVDIFALFYMYLKPSIIGLVDLAGFIKLLSVLSMDKNKVFTIFLNLKEKWE